MSRKVVVAAILVMALLLLGTEIDKALGLSTGTFAGLVGGVLVLGGWIAAMIYRIYRVRRKKKRQRKFSDALEIDDAGDEVIILSDGEFDDFGFDIDIGGDGGD